MKQMIVLIATIILGLAIAGVVLGFRTDVGSMNTTIAGGIDAMQEDMEAALEDL